MQDLKDVTRETHYENYRAQCIQSMTRMVVKERNRKYAVTIQAAEAVFSLFISFCFEQKWPQKVFGNLSHIRYLHFEKKKFYLYIAFPRLKVALQKVHFKENKESIHNTAHQVQIIENTFQMMFLTGNESRPRMFRRVRGNIKWSFT